MPASAIVKIALSLCVMWSVRTSFSAPQPPAKESELYHPKGYEVRILPGLIKYFSLLCCIGDILATITTAYPNSTSSFAPFLIHYDPLSTPAPSSLYILSAILTLSGGLLRKWCYTTMGRMFTFELAIQDDHKLITTGPYSIVRHPSYVGAFACVCGALGCYTTRGSWFIEELRVLTGESVARGLVNAVWGAIGFVTMTVGAERLRKEDEMLKNEFGKEWDEWARRVPRRLIPGVY